jgi:hypothetical protein
MRIVVVTSGTGKKSRWSDSYLTKADFEVGQDHVPSRLRARVDDLVAAEDLYAGDQHTRLMAGVRAFRELWPEGSPHVLDLRIVSPGYGLIRGEAQILPYNASFEGMNASAIRRWSAARGIPTAMRGLLGEKFDLAFLLLGNAYLAACALEDVSNLGGSTFVLGGGQAATGLPPAEGLRVVPLGWPEAKSFGCLQLALKGVIVGGWLRRLAKEPALAKSLANGTVDPVTGWSEAV